MRQFVAITDVIKQKNGLFCLGGIHPTSGKSIRLLPDLTSDQLLEKGISVGCLVECEFEQPATWQDGVEEHESSSCEVVKMLPKHDFQKILKHCAVSNLHKLFQIGLHEFFHKLPNQFQSVSIRRFYTLRVMPYTISLKNQFLENCLKISFSDGEGGIYQNMPVVDSRFEKANHFLGGIPHMEKKLKQTAEMYFRIGICEEKLHFQVNAIHCFESSLCRE